MKTLVFLLLATATSASTYGTFGVAAHHPSGELGQVKWVEFGKQKEMKKFDYRLGTGGYTDKTSSPGAQSSLYGVAQWVLFFWVILIVFLGLFFRSVIVLASELRTIERSLLESHTAISRQAESLNETLVGN
jgi:hypothetical protein